MYIHIYLLINIHGHTDIYIYENIKIAVNSK